MKKLSLFVLLLALAITLLLTACSSEPQSPSDPKETTGEIVETKPGFTFYENGAYNAIIVYPKGGNIMEENLAFTLSYRMSMVYGTAPAVYSDNNVDESDSDQNMILIGNTKFSESKEVAARTNYGSYHTELVGNKYVIFAYTAKANIAITGIIENKLDAALTVIDESWNTDEVTEQMLSNIPAYQGGILSDIVDDGDGSHLVIISKTNEQEYDAYLEHAVSCGLDAYAENKIGENKFLTFTNDESIVNMMYLANLSEVRLTVDSKEMFTTPGLAEDNVYTAEYESSVTQLGLENGTEFQNGMGYIFKLADGSLIVIDGGINTDHNIDLLINALKELSPDPDNINIAAWFITHFHSDHWGTIKRIMNKGGFDLQIEKLIFNLPNEEILKGVSGEDETGNGTLEKVDEGEYTKRRTNVLKMLGQLPENTEIIKAHPGQVFHIRNAVVTVLASYDLVYPENTYNLNDSSVVTRIEIEGQSFLFPADSATTESNITLEIYGEALKSDFLQVIHHGYSGGFSEYYESVDPIVVFWPVGRYDFEERVKDREINEYFFREEGTNIKEIFVAGTETVTLPLPYALVEENK